MPRKSKTKLTGRRLGVVAGTLLVGLVVAAGLYLHNLNTRIDRLELIGIKSALIDAINGLSMPPAIEPSTGRLFIPAAKLMLPASTESRLSVRGYEDTYWFSTNLNMQQGVAAIRGAISTEDVFKEVARTQACSRQGVVVLGKASGDSALPDDKLKLVLTKTLKDGRVANIYQNDSCPYGAEPLMRDLKQLESF